MYDNKMYKDMYYGYLKCARSARKIGFTKSQITDKTPWFFQVDFFKFHDFSMFFGLFPNSMIFPGLEKVFFIFQVSMIFPEAGNPVSNWWRSHELIGYWLFVPSTHWYLHQWSSFCKYCITLFTGLKIASLEGMKNLVNNVISKAKFHSLTYQMVVH